MSVLFLIFLPLLGGLATLLYKDIKKARLVALCSSMLSLVIAIVFLYSFINDANSQFEIAYPWIDSLGVSFKIGLDGINIILVFLTNLLIPLILFTTINQKSSRVLFSLILFMQVGLLTVFTALDAFLFYVGWETALIPIYFICAMWGGKKRVSVSIKFFIYTMFGSLLMLVALIYLHLQTPGRTYDMLDFYHLHLPLTQQNWVFFAFFLAFAIKIPIIPFHSWQPETYVEAPSVGNMLLSGIMLKMGIYGIIRWLIPIAPGVFFSWLPWVLTFSIGGSIYASIIALKQKNIKRLLAYSSIAHVGLIASGVFVWNPEGLHGAIIQMLSHGINVVGMFFIADIIERRLKTQTWDTIGGIAKVAPHLSITFLIILLGAIALPLGNGFIGELLLLIGISTYHIWAAGIGAIGMVLSAIYMLRLYQGTMLGPITENAKCFDDINWHEKVVLYTLCALVIGVGIYPKPLLHVSDTAVANLIAVIQSKI